jgi:phospholipid-binding lipoprotein MlaA
MKIKIAPNIKVLSLLMGIMLAFSPSLVVADSWDNDDKLNYDYADGGGVCNAYDPYEKINRKIFFFNGFLDTFTLRPVAKIYGRFTNDYTKSRVRTFVDNISEPLSTVNYGLQGNGEGMFKSFWRFTINSTFGIAGLFDVASKVGLNPEPQTLGSTLAYYGVGPGPYIVLPIYGGMGARNVSDPLISNNLLNPLKYALHKDFKLGVTIAKTIHYRSDIMPFTDYVTKNSPDPYVAIRNAILSQNESKMAYPIGFRCPAAR